MNNLDIIIPIAENDIEALKASLPYIQTNLGANSKIIIVGKKSLNKTIKKIRDVTFLDEDSIFPNITYSNVYRWISQRLPKATRRTGWYFQQFIKLGYSRICENEYYLTWDSDTIPLRQLSFFDEDGNPLFDVIPTVKYDETYEGVIQTFWNSDEVKILRDHSYITEHMLFNKTIAKSLIADIEKSNIAGDNFAEKIINAIPVDKLNLSGFSEFETYALYALSNFKDFYRLRTWRNLRHGKAFFGKEPSMEQLNWISGCFDVVSIEDFDKQLLICKLLCRNKVIKRLNFKKIYLIIDPYISVKFKIRMAIRKAIRS